MPDRKGIDRAELISFSLILFPCMVAKTGSLVGNIGVNGGKRTWLAKDASAAGRKGRRSLGSSIARS
jgi:hypothetical protein